MMLRLCSAGLCFLWALSLGAQCWGQNGSRRYRAYRPTIASASAISKKAVYRLGPGDVVGVIVEGVVGSFASAEVRMPDRDDLIQLPAFGHPVMVMPDGTLPLPLVDPVSVVGMSLTQARDKVSRTYLNAKILRKPHQVWISLMRKRTVTVNVLHHTRAGNIQPVSKVTLPGDRASVIAALAESGGFDPKAMPRLIRSGPSTKSSASSTGPALRDGDTIELDSPAAGYFFSGGMLRASQHRLPNDRSINALQAISVASGIPVSRFGNTHRQVVIIRNGSTARIPYREVLRNPSAYPIRSGDHVWVQ